MPATVAAKNEPTSPRISRLGLVVVTAALLLLVKVFVAILWEYPRYFPPDFESNYLAGRRYSFAGEFRIAFYVHILSSPFALLIGLGLMLSGGRARFRVWHRWAGRVQAMLVFLIVAPSGMVMAKYAYAGPMAGAGFATLNLAVVGCLVIAIHRARKRRFASHRRWATRCFLLLCSPLLLRLFAGVVITFDLESDWTYRLNAWLSWMIPLAIYETCTWSRKWSRWTG